MGLLFFTNILSRLLFVWNTCFQRAFQSTIKSRLKQVGMNFYIDYPAQVIGLDHVMIGDHFTARRGLKLRAFSQYEKQLFCPEIIIGDSVSIETDCHIGAINKVKIGNHVLIASHVFITDHSHGRTDFSDIEIPPLKRELTSKGEIIIEDNVWIGENAVILSGVVIGKNSIIGANSVVTHSIPANCIAAGVPARVIKQLDRQS